METQDGKIKLGVLMRAFEDLYDIEFCRVFPFDPERACAEAPVAEVPIYGKVYPIWSARHHEVIALEHEFGAALNVGRILKDNIGLFYKLAWWAIRGRSRVDKNGEIVPASKGGEWSLSLDQVTDLPIWMQPLLIEAALIFLWRGPLTRAEWLTYRPREGKAVPTSATSGKKASRSRVAS